MLNKIIKKVLFVICLGCLGILFSCSDNIHSMKYKDYGYYICGLYFNCDNTITDKTMDDNNPKVYLNFSNYETKKVIGVGTSSGFDAGWINYGDTSRTFNLDKNNIMVVQAWASMTFMGYFENSVDTHPIYLKDGKYIIDTSITEKVAIGKGNYPFKTSFTVNKQKFKVCLNINPKTNSNN